MAQSKQCKILVIGTEAAGKTELVAKLRDPNQPFNPSYNPTIAIDFKSYKVNSEITFSFWDTAGQSRFRSLIKPFFRTSQIIVLCIDLSKSLDQNAIKEFIEDAKNARGNEKTPIVLVWTKSDAKQVVTNEEISALSTNEDYKFAQVFTVSSKENKGVNELRDNLITLGKDALAEAEQAQAKSLAEANKGDIDKALLILNRNSALYQTLLNFKYHILQLPTKKQGPIAAATLKLVNSLNSSTDVHIRIQAIVDFEIGAKGHLGGNYPKLVAAVVGVAITALVTVIAAAVGFGIGFLAGAWTGPGAFISGVLAGTAGACAVVSVSAALGGGLGLFGGFAKYNSAVSQNAFINEVVEAARADCLGTQLQTPSISG